MQDDAISLLYFSYLGDPTLMLSTSLPTAVSSGVQTTFTPTKTPSVASAPSRHPTPDCPHFTVG